MIKKLIEFVCTGNQGRSPVAELIARTHLERIGAYGDYNSISSGTLVNIIESGNHTINSMKPVIDIALERPLYSSEEIKELEEALKQGNTSIVRKYFDIVINLFDEEEVRNRAEVLPLLGIHDRVKTTRDQVVARPDTVAVLSMDRGNYSMVKGLYESSSYSPLIDVLSRFAIGNPNAEVKNTFGKVKEDYIRCVEQMLEEVPVAVNKIVDA